MDQVDHLKSLGSTTKYHYDEPSVGILETFPNRYPNNPYLIYLNTSEFTSLCPKTGQPDFGRIEVKYAPRDLCIESKSFKLYMFAYRNHKSFMESMVNKILEDLVAACDPRYIEVIGHFNARGGTDIKVKRTYRDEEKWEKE